MEKSNKQSFDINEHLFVEISDDSMEVFVRMEFPGTAFECEIDEVAIKKLLLKQRINFGLIEENIKRIAAKLNEGSVSRMSLWLLRIFSCC